MYQLRVKNRMHDQPNTLLVYCTLENMMTSCFAFVVPALGPFVLEAGRRAAEADSSWPLPLSGIAENPAWATLPLSLNLLGTMSSGIPASLSMQRIGRRNGFRIGTVVGLLGALLNIYAIQSESFTLFCLGSYLIDFDVAVTGLALRTVACNASRLV